MQNGIPLIKRFEGCRLKAYPDPGTGGAPWTIGYGHTGPDVHPGLCISQEQADALLAQDYTVHESAVRRLVKAPLTENQLGALTSLVFNIGAHNFATSTLLRLLSQHLYNEAAEQFEKWTRAAGRVLPGLVTRRQAEKALFLLP